MIVGSLFWSTIQMESVTHLRPLHITRLTTLHGSTCIIVMIKRIALSDSSRKSCWGPVQTIIYRVLGNDYVNKNVLTGLRKFCYMRYWFGGQRQWIPRYKAAATGSALPPSVERRLAGMVSATDNEGRRRRLLTSCRQQQEWAKYVFTLDNCVNECENHVLFIIDLLWLLR
jgi:hypothetical protein